MKGYEQLRYLRTEIASDQLLLNVKVRLGRERAETAEALADLAEIDRRQIYREQGYPSMFEYCVHELHLSEASAFKRIRAARAARRFPAIFTAVAEGRLHLSAICMLAAHLTRENAGDLLCAATRLTKEQMQQLLAARFPSPDVPTVLRTLPAAGWSTPALAPGPVVAGSPPNAPAPFKASAVAGEVPATLPLAPGPVQAGRESAPEPDRSAPKPGGITPLATERYAFQVTIPQGTRDKPKRAQQLLGSRISAGDLAGVLDCALDALIRQLEKRKYAITDRPQRVNDLPRNPRTIPAAVRLAVFERDQGRCTFVTRQGRQCESRANLEFDHIEPIARGGASTLANLRLRCRAHNQLEADRAFGADFMRGKRAAASP